MTDVDSNVNQSVPQSSVGHQFSTLAQATNNSFLGDFAMTNLPGMLKGLWSNANKIIASEGVGKAPGIANTHVMVSNTSGGFHRISLDSKGCQVKCDCAHFEELHLCAHLLAVGYYEKCLSDVIKKYQPNISSIVKPSKKAGKKPNQSVRKRRTACDDQRVVSQYSEAKCKLRTSLSMEHSLDET